MIQLNLGDHRSLYEQISEKIKELIISGVLLENDKIPSVREMAAMLAINPNTIQKAYKELENEGYIYSQKARGNFVSPREVGDKTKAYELIEDIKPQIKELRFLGMNKNELKNLIDSIYEEEEL